MFEIFEYSILTPLKGVLFEKAISHLFVFKRVSEVQLRSRKQWLILEGTRKKIVKSKRGKF